MTQGIVPMVRSALIAGLSGLLILAAGDALAVGPAGTWVGEMRSADGGEFEIELTLDGSGAAWSGTLVEADQDTISLENLRVTSTRILFTFHPGNGPVAAHFTGGYIAGDDRITGTFSMRGTSRFVKFERVEDADEFAAEALEEAPALPDRHPYRIGVTPRVAYWPSLHAVREEIYTLNNLTTSQLNFDVALRWYVLDSFCVLGRYYRGGQGMTDDPAKLEAFSDLDVSGDSKLKLDGWEIGVMGFLGKKITSESRFNPYLTATAGRVDWALHSGDRGSPVVVLEDTRLSGDDWAFAFGLGTEYALSDRVALEFEWLWRFFLTKDEDKWPDADRYWKDTMAWSLAFGATIGVF